MDLQMPEMNGFEATGYIRNIMKLQTPIIAITTDVINANLEKCLTVGMNDYLTKPIDEALLHRKIIELATKPEMKYFIPNSDNSINPTDHSILKE